MATDPRCYGPGLARYGCRSLSALGLEDGRRGEERMTNSYMVPSLKTAWFFQSCMFLRCQNMQWDGDPPTRSPSAPDSVQQGLLIL